MHKFEVGTRFKTFRFFKYNMFLLYSVLNRITPGRFLVWGVGSDKINLKESINL